MNDKETEIKFYINEPQQMVGRILLAGAGIAEKRTFERNLRLDTADLLLSSQQRVLRLRQDSQARITYKGPAEEHAEVSVRQEIECTVDDFEKAWRLFAALGYQVSVEYEKYRTTYRSPDLEIFVDEMPFGTFIEIEGQDAETIHNFAQNIGLDWNSRCKQSYLELFGRLQAQGLQAKNLTFSELEGKNFTAESLGLSPADE